MQLHANAALSLKRRAVMVREVVEQDRSIAEAAGGWGVATHVSQVGPALSR